MPKLKSGDVKRLIGGMGMRLVSEPKVIVSGLSGFIHCRLLYVESLNQIEQYLTSF
jgi:hypothetical protein